MPSYFVYLLHNFFPLQKNPFREEHGFALKFLFLWWHLSHSPKQNEHMGDGGMDEFEGKTFACLNFQLQKHLLVSNSLDFGTELCQRRRELQAGQLRSLKKKVVSK